MSVDDKLELAYDWIKSAAEATDHPSRFKAIDRAMYVLEKARREVFDLYTQDNMRAVHRACERLKAIHHEDDGLPFAGIED